MKIHPKAVKGDKNQVGAPMPGTVLSTYCFVYSLTIDLGFTSLIDTINTCKVNPIIISILTQPVLNEHFYWKRITNIHISL